MYVCMEAVNMYGLADVGVHTYGLDHNPAGTKNNRVFGSRESGRYVRVRTRTSPTDELNARIIAALL